MLARAAELRDLRRGAARGGGDGATIVLFTSPDRAAATIVLFTHPLVMVVRIVTEAEISSLTAVNHGRAHQKKRTVMGLPMRHH